MSRLWENGEEKSMEGQKKDKEQVSEDSLTTTVVAEALQTTEGDQRHHTLHPHPPTAKCIYVYNNPLCLQSSFFCTMYCIN